MKTKLTEWLVKPYLNESPDLDIKVGDDILMGRFKNKRVKVKSITYNEKGDLLINGRPALKFRKVKNKKKLLPSKTTNKSSAEPDADRKGVDDEYPFHKTEAKRIPRKKGQHRGSKSHSDLYTDENPKGTIKGLKFATVDDAKKSVSKIRNSGRSHAHKIQKAAVAMEQRAREMGKTSQAAVYRAYINQMKKKTKKKNESFAAVAGALYGGDIPSPSRKGVKKMKKKGNTSVPYGSGYKKIDERYKKAVSGRKVHKHITGFNLPHKGRKYKEIDFETRKIDNKTEMVTLRILNPKKLFGQELVVSKI